MDSSTYYVYSRLLSPRKGTVRPSQEQMMLDKRLVTAMSIIIMSRRALDVCQD